MQCCYDYDGMHVQFSQINNVSTLETVSESPNYIFPPWQRNDTAEHTYLCTGPPSLGSSRVPTSGITRPRSELATQTSWPPIGPTVKRNITCCYHPSLPFELNAYLNFPL